MRRASAGPITVDGPRRGGAAARVERLETRRLLATVSGHVISDYNVDGVAGASETGAAGFTVYLDLNHNAQPDAAEPAAVTDAAGAYVLDAGAVTGDVHVRLAERVNWGFTAPTTGVRTVTIASPQQNVTGADFLASDRSIFTGRIFNDADGDGTFDVGESPLPGWTVFVDLNHNDRNDPGEYTVVSDAAGVYALNLPGAGPDPFHRHYHIVQPRPDGWHRTTPAFTDLVTVITRPGRVFANLDYGSRAFAAVAGRQVFYNNSAFDNRDRTANAADDNAIAPDKAALQPGWAATATNITSYSRGINGVMVDVAGAWGVTTASDFTVKAGRTADPSTWADAPAPGVSVRPGAGAGGSDRVTLTWPDGALRNTWVQVTVKATAATGLAGADVFTFGNLVGDAGAISPGRTDALDLAATRRAARTTATDLLNRFDFNRDGRVNALDLALVRAHRGRSLSLLL